MAWHDQGVIKMKMRQVYLKVGYKQVDDVEDR